MVEVATVELETVVGELALLSTSSAAQVLTQNEFLPTCTVMVSRLLLLIRTFRGRL